MTDIMTKKLGLINSTKNLEVPLKEIQNSVSIKGFTANVHSTLVYENKEPAPIEAEFVFPMHDQSCVYKFEAEIEGRHIVAELQDKTQARETYDDAIASGQTAMFMSEDDQSSDIFEIKLGNLPANTEAKLTLAYVRELPVEPDGTLVFTLPTQLNPRYTPAGSVPTLDSKVTYVSSSSIPYSMTFTAKIEGNFIIEQVQSKKEKLKVQKSENGKTATVDLDEPYKFDHDLSLEIKYQSINEPQIILEQKLSDGVGLLKEDVLMLNYFPEFKEETTIKGEYVFIIDRSGSMQGHSIQQAKETLLLLIKSLPQGCMFNIIGFGSRFEALFEKSQIYNEQSLKRAKEHQESIKADMGGTEILEPMKHVYSVDVQTTYSRQVFLLTDGGVSNTNEVIALVKRNACTTRVFSFGIGSGASTSLVEGVAKVSGGKATYVSDNDRLQSKVVSALKCSMEPSITNIELEWNLPKGISATNIPSRPPMVFKGEKLILYAIIQGDIKKGVSMEGTVMLKGKMEGKDIKHTQIFDLSSAGITDELAPLHRLAAKTQIKELEYDLNLIEYDRGLGEETKRKIVLVSTAAGVVSKYTAFVGIDKERGQPVEGEVIRRVIPQYLQYAASYNLCNSPQKFCSRSSPVHYNLKAKTNGGIPLSFNFSFGGFFGRKKKAKPRHVKSAVTCSAMSAASFEKQYDMYADALCSEASTSDSGGASSSTDDKQLMVLIDYQAFDGSWNLTKMLALLFEKTVEEIQKGNPVQNELVWTTALAVAWLRLKQSAKKDEWELIEKKAMDWLSHHDQEGKSTDEILQLASSFLSTP